MPIEMDREQSLDLWHREGPARMRTSAGKDGESFVRVNQPRACLGCKKKRIRCSVFESGAPCASCSKHGQACTIGDDHYDSSSPHQTAVFIPVLPPPPAPCSTPTEGAAETFKLDVEAVAERLKVSGTRPAPLVWKSVDEVLVTSAPIPISRSRAKRSHKPNTSDESAEEPPIKTPRSLFSFSAPKSVPQSVESRVKPQTICKPRKEGESIGDDGLLLAVFTSGSKLASPFGEAARKARSREWFEGRGCDQPTATSAFKLSNRVSSARDEPVPVRPSALHLTRPEAISIHNSTSYSSSSSPLHMSHSAPVASSLAHLLNPISSPFRSPAGLHCMPSRPPLPSYITQSRPLSWGEESDWFDDE